MFIISDYELADEQRPELEEYYKLISEMFYYLSLEQQLILESAPDSKLEQTEEYIKKLYSVILKLQSKFK